MNLVLDVFLYLENKAKALQEIHEELIGGFNPFEKYARQIGSFPQVGVKKKIFETTT